MATTKDLRITFFYSDEAIFKKVKEWKTRYRIVKWANEFYARYGFKIDEFPYAWNEAKYKKDFCLQKKNGLKVLYTLDSKIITGEIIKAKEERDQLLKNFKTLTHDDDPNSAYAKNQVRYDEVINHIIELADVKNQINFERPLEFRKQIQKKLKQTKGKTDRLMVVFCQFEDALAKYGIKPPGIAETFAKDHELFWMLLWNLLASADEEIFSGVVIFIDIYEMTKRYEYVLAHEIVHAAGNTTADNKGTKGNIMIYADAEGKAPTNVNLEPNDKARLDVAYFVV